MTGQPRHLPRVTPPAPGPASPMSRPPSLPRPENVTAARAMMSARVTMEEAIRLVTLMLADRGNAAAERSYLKSLAGYLVTQPRAVAIACCDPHRGVASEVPTRIVIADLARWCAVHSEPIAEILRDDFRRRMFGPPDDQPLPREGRETLAELRARYGRKWGLQGIDPALDARQRASGQAATTGEAAGAALAAALRAASERQIAAEYARLGVSPVRDGTGSLLSPALVRAVNPALLRPGADRDG